MFILLWFLGHDRPSISRKVSSVTNLKILFESHTAGTKAISYFCVWAKMRKNGGSHGVAWPFTGHQSMQMVLWLGESRLRESIDCWWHRRCRGERWWGSKRGWQHGHPPGQQPVCDLRAISVTPLGNGAPRRGIPSCAPFPLVPHRHHFCIRDVWEWRRKAEGRPASQMGPRGSKAWWSGTLPLSSVLVSKHHLPYNLRGVLDMSFWHNPLWRTAKTRFCNQATPPACLS